MLIHVSLCTCYTCAFTHTLYAHKVGACGYTRNLYTCILCARARTHLPRLLPIYPPTYPPNFHLSEKVWGGVCVHTIYLYACFIFMCLCACVHTYRICLPIYPPTFPPNFHLFMSLTL